MTNLESLKQDFKYAIIQGSGRAYLLAKANPAVDFSEYIIEAALKNFAYEKQVESNRAKYLYDLYCLSTQQAQIRHAVLQALATEQNDTWSLAQLFGLAMLFAQHGDAEARSAIYSRFLTNPIIGAEWLGAREIMTLDSLEGLEYIARKFGQVLAKDPSEWQDDDLIQFFQKQYPTVDAWTELGLLAEHDNDISRYLRNVEATVARQAADKRLVTVDPTVEEILRAPRRGHYLNFKFKKGGLMSHEVHQLAERLLIEQNQNVLENLLYVFGIYKFPLAYQPILDLARQKQSSKGSSVELALGALKLLRAPEIREFALQKISALAYPAEYTAILSSNYQEGDATLLTALVDRATSEHAIEMLADSYTKIYRVNKTPECAAPLLALYQKMTCGIHRKEVVEILLENGVLPDWVKEELPFDSLAETRLLYQSQ